MLMIATDTRQLTEEVGVSNTEAKTETFTQAFRISTRGAWALACLFVLTGCCSFERDWRTCGSYVSPANDLAGCWEGRWHSDKNGHNGTLRAIITKQGENEYHARFKATFAWILPYRFEIPLAVSEEGGVAAFESQADLGKLAGGVYSYAGQADGCEFVATYCASGGDHGTFTMRRSQTCADCCEQSPCCEPSDCAR